MMKGWWSKLHSWCNKHEWVILFVGLVILFRIPTLFTPHYYGDEEIYFVMGRAWREGVPMYQAMFDHKPPLIYVLAGIAESVFWFRMMLLVVMALHTVLFYKLAKIIFDKTRPQLAKLSTFIFVVLTTIPTFEGNIANAELFMMLPITASLLMVMPSFEKNEGYKKYSWQKYLAAGLVGGVGWLFKVPVVFDFVAIALFIFVFRAKTLAESVKGIFNLSFLSYVVGFLIPLASTFVYYFAKGHGPAYLDTVFTINLSYVSSWNTSTFAFNPLKSGLISRGLVLGTFAIFMYLIRNKISKKLLFVSMWLAFSFFGSLLSARPYPHYLLEPFVPLSLFIPFFFVVENVLSWSLIGALLIWGLLMQKQIKFWAYDTTSLYKNFWLRATNQIGESQYIYTFDGAERNYKIADYLQERMVTGDKLYLWGSDAALYNLTKTLPSGGKYMVNFHVHDFRAEDYVMQELDKSMPRFVVVLPDSTEFLQLKILLDRKYIETLRVEGARVYMRVNNEDAI